MGTIKTRMQIFRLIITFMLSISIFCAMAEEVATSQTSASNYGYSVKARNKGELVWTIRDTDGGVLDLDSEEKQRILREICFPRALKHAEIGKGQAVWTVGFFYLDGVATDKNLAKAEVAFRRGLEFERSDGLLLLGSIYHIMAVAEKREEYFRRAGDLYKEVLSAGFKIPVPNMISLASTYMYGWYDMKKDLNKAEELLESIEKVLPEDPHVQLTRAKLCFRQKRYPEAFDCAEQAEQGLLAVPKKLKEARAFKIASAALGGQISKIDPKELIEFSKQSLGLNGSMAWAIPAVMLLVLGFLLWLTRRVWRNEPGKGPGIWLSLFWISVATLGAGIGFAISLPGLDNLIGHWIGAMLVTLVCVFAMKSGGWRRYFGSAPLCAGPKYFLKGLAIIVGCITAMILILLGYTEIYELVTGRVLDQQLASLLLKSENLWQLFGTVLIAGIAIPFYEELIFRGFLFDSLGHRWGTKMALVVSSVFFALVHGPTFALPLLFLAFALGWFRIKTGNLKMSFLIHAANNTFSIIIGYFVSV